MKAVPLYDGDIITRKKISVKNFTIQHPRDEDRYLIHACLEGATADVFYRGQDMIDIGNDYIDIKLPDFYCKLVKRGTSTLLLTAIGRPFFKLGVEIFEEENRVRVYSDNKYGEIVRFYWEIKGERVETEFDAEPLKNDVKVYGFGPYTYYY